MDIGELKLLNFEEANNYKHEYNVYIENVLYLIYNLPTQQMVVMIVMVMVVV